MVREVRRLILCEIDTESKDFISMVADILRELLWGYNISKAPLPVDLTLSIPILHFPVNKVVKLIMNAPTISLVCRNIGHIPFELLLGRWPLIIIIRIIFWELHLDLLNLLVELFKLVSFDSRLYFIASVLIGLFDLREGLKVKRPGRI